MGRSPSTAGGSEGGLLAIANDDGTGLRALARLTAGDAQPAWSPGGTSLVFRGRKGSNYDLYVVGANGTGLRRLTRAPARDSEPAWTGARGGWVVFRGGRNLFRIRPDGTGLRRLTRRGGIDPAWSPHGTRIAFTRRADVYVMRADGRRLHRLTRRGGTAPIWSPDLWAMRSSGRGARALIAGDVTVGGFDWGRQR